MTTPAEDPRGGEWVCKYGHTESQHWVDGYYSCPHAQSAERTARSAGDRAQPTEELREQVARWLCENRYGEGAWDHFSVHEHDHWRGRTDALLAGPLAALLDAQNAGGSGGDV